MPRPPFPVARARRLLTEWAELRVPKSPDDAPITVGAAVAHLKENKLPTHRATLYKHRLHELVDDAARRQREEGGGRQSAAERRGYEEQLRGLRDENRQLDERNRHLLGVIATMTWNARRMGVPDEEIRAPMPKPDRSESRAGEKTRRRQP